MQVSRLMTRTNVDEEGSLSERFKMVTSLKTLHFLSLADRKQVDGLSHTLLETSKQMPGQQMKSPETTKSMSGLQRSDSMTSNRSSRTLGVSSRYQREKVAEAMQMVEREGAVIDAVMSRLEGLKLRT